jgi:hypothetical protein
LSGRAATDQEVRRAERLAKAGPPAATVYFDYPTEAQRKRLTLVHMKLIEIFWDDVPYVALLIALALFALWPFTRLVHAFSAPIAYLFRPYIVYRSREVADNQELIGSAPRRRGW